MILKEGDLILSRAREVLGWEPHYSLDEGSKQHNSVFSAKAWNVMTGVLSNPRERTRFFRFLVVGCFGAVVDFGIENLLHRFFGVPYVWAGTISFICAILSNFFWNRYWTYPDSRSKPILQQLFQFSLVNVSGLIIRLPILWLVRTTYYEIFL